MRSGRWPKERAAVAVALISSISGWAEAQESKTEAAPENEEQKEERVAALMRETERDDPFFADDQRPSSGRPYVIAGWSAVAIGGVGFGFCAMGAMAEDSNQRGCPAGFVAVGIAGLSVGTPLLVVGWVKNRNLNDWKKRHPHVAQLLEARVSVRPGELVFSYETNF